MRFFIGDVRDIERLYRTFDGVDYIIHDAQNVIDAAIDKGVKKLSHCQLINR